MKRTAVAPAITSTTNSRPTAESIAAEIDASSNPSLTRQAVRELLDELDHPESKPVSAVAVWTLPVATLLDRAGITLTELTATEAGRKVFGILVRQDGGRAIIATPGGLDLAERDRIIRQLIWRQVNNPVTADKPIHLVQGER